MFQLTNYKSVVPLKLERSLMTYSCIMSKGSPDMNKVADLVWYSRP